MVQSASTYETIRNALDDPAAPFHSKRYSIFLQGSYGNDTNIWSDSDVDVVMRLTSIYYYDISSLSPEDKDRFERSKIPGQYSFEQFKAEVLGWLTEKFGSGVRAGKKAILIPGNTSRRDADVLVCVNHRNYTSFPSEQGAKYHDGICFWTADGVKIINYPKQHMENCTTKHQSTSTRFKPNIRIWKNMRNALIDQRLLQDGIAPSYFIEGLLWNIPNENFVNSFQNTFVNINGWLDRCNPTQLVCANQRYYLLRDGHPVCWNNSDYLTFIKVSRKFWENSR
jgi:hypothetical protein